LLNKNPVIRNNNEERNIYRNWMYSIKVWVIW
jgi:hypothetical protein